MDAAWPAAILIRDLENVAAELAAFPDDRSVWATPPGITNSAGTLVLHLTGNIRWFIGGVLGRDGYVRDRDREFAARDLPRAELAAGLDQAIAVVRRTFGPGSRIDFDGTYPDSVGGAFSVVTGEWLIHLAAHLGFHLGQIGYLRRLATESKLSVVRPGIDRLSSAKRVG